MTDFDIAICMTVKASDAKDAKSKVDAWLEKQILPKWVMDHEVSDAREVPE